MDRLPAAVRTAGGLTLFVSIGVVLAGVFLTVHLSPTSDAVYRAAVGADLWRWGWIGIPASIVALKTRRRVALGIAGAAGAAVVSSVLIAVAAVELNPRPGLERTAAAFEPPDGAVPHRGSFRRFSFPNLVMQWQLPVAGEDACQHALAVQAAAWSDAAPVRRDYDSSCSFTGRRDVHLVRASTRWRTDVTTEAELILVVARDV